MRLVASSSQPCGWVRLVLPVVRSVSAVRHALEVARVVVVLVAVSVVNVVPGRDGAEVRFPDCTV